MRGGVQEVEIEVKGGYSPDLIRVKQGVPVRLVFDRQDNSGCTERVVFPDFGVGRSLAPFAKTTVELVPRDVGEFAWACGMNMLHGRLVVEADGGSGTATGAETTGAFAQAVGQGPTQAVDEVECVHFSLLGSLNSLPTRVVDIERQLRGLQGVEKVEVNQGSGRVSVSYDGSSVKVPPLRDALAKASGYEVQDRSEPGSSQTEDAKAAARQAEVRDLMRRVAVGAVLTAPVLYAAMVGHFLGEHLVPHILMNNWVQPLRSAARTATLTVKEGVR